MKKYLVIFIVIIVFYYLFRYCVQPEVQNFTELSTTTQDLNIPFAAVDNLAVNALVAATTADKQAADALVAATADKQAADALVAATADKQAADKLIADALVAAADKQAADKQAADKQAADKQAADKLVADALVVAADKQAADKLIADALLAAADKQAAADKLIADALIADKLVADKLVADKLVADKLAADKLAADKLAANDNFNNLYTTSSNLQQFMNLFRLTIDQKYDDNAILSDDIVINIIKYVKEIYDNNLSNEEENIITTYIKFFINDTNFKFRNNNNIIRINKRFPIGVIIAWNSELIPVGWVICDGFNGTPDLRGRFILSSGLHKNKKGQTISNRKINQKGGAEKVTLTIDQIPKHKHSWEAYNDDYNGYHKYDQDDKNIGKTTLNDETGFFGLEDDNNNRKTKIMTNVEGDSQPYEIMPPFYVLTYIMKIK